MKPTKEQILEWAENCHVMGPQSPSVQQFRALCDMALSSLAQPQAGSLEFWDNERIGQACLGPVAADHIRALQAKLLEAETELARQEANYRHWDAVKAKKIERLESELATLKAQTQAGKGDLERVRGRVKALHELAVDLNGLTFNEKMMDALRDITGEILPLLDSLASPATPAHESVHYMGSLEHFTICGEDWGGKNVSKSWNGVDCPDCLKAKVRPINRTGIEVTASPATPSREERLESALETVKRLRAIDAFEGNCPEHRLEVMPDCIGCQGQKLLEQIEALRNEPKAGEGL